MFYCQSNMFKVLNRVLSEWSRSVFLDLTAFFYKRITCTSNVLFFFLPTFFPCLFETVRSRLSIRIARLKCTVSLQSVYVPRCVRPVLSRPRAIFCQYGPCTCAYISRIYILISSMVSTHISMMDHLSGTRCTLDFHHSLESFSRDHSFVVPSKLSQNVRWIRYAKSVKVKSFSLLWIL